MPNSKELVNIFRSYFPNLVIEKWYPGGYGKKDTHSIRVMTTKREAYMFTFNSKTDWTLRRCLHPTKDRNRNETD